MEFIENSCRVCLTTEEDDEKFKKIDVSIAKKIYKIFKIQLKPSSSLICKQCECDIETSWTVFNRLHDAGDYYEFHEKQKSTETLSRPGNGKESKVSVEPKEKRTKPLGKNVSSGVVYECDACKATFKNMQFLNWHMASHNGK